MVKLIILESLITWPVKVQKGQRIDDLRLLVRQRALAVHACFDHHCQTLVRKGFRRWDIDPIEADRMLLEDVWEWVKEYAPHDIRKRTEELWQDVKESHRSWHVNRLQHSLLLCMMADFTNTMLLESQM